MTKSNPDRERARGRGQPSPPISHLRGVIICRPLSLHTFAAAAAAAKVGELCLEIIGDISNDYIADASGYMTRKRKAMDFDRLSMGRLVQKKWCVLCSGVSIPRQCRQCRLYGINRDPRSDYFHLDSLLWILQASFEFELRREYTEHYLCKKVQPQML